MRMRISTGMRLDSVVILFLMMALTVYLPTGASRTSQGLPDYKLMRICQTDSLLCSTLIHAQSLVPMTGSENNANLLDKSSDGEASGHYTRGKSGDRSVVGAYNRRIPRIGKYMRFGRGRTSLTELNTVNNDFQRLMRNSMRFGQTQVY